jgi:hypothetical protein
MLILGSLILLLPVAGPTQEEAAEAFTFRGYPGAPSLKVVPRKDELFFYPCSQCHASMEPNPEIRQLNVMHDAEIEHGDGRLWCLNCHDLEERDNLRTLLGEPVDFDDAHLVCGGCHANRHRDWAFGVHGKRLANWQGDREVYNCTHCHNPHQPAIAPRAPQAPPPVRAGLERQDGEIHDRAPVWQRSEDEDE